jgi:hemolysin D
MKSAELIPTLPRLAWAPRWRAVRLGLLSLIGVAVTVPGDVPSDALNGAVNALTDFANHLEFDFSWFYKPLWFAGGLIVLASVVSLRLVKPTRSDLRRASPNRVNPPSRPPRRSREELAFLPAALEVVETPAPPLAGAVSVTIIAVFCAAVVWASVGTVDIVASAQGRIIPSGRTKLIQPFETGVVRAIHVQDGQKVSAGDVLIELDPTMSSADTKHLAADLQTAELDVSRLRAALENTNDPLSVFSAPAGAKPDLVATQTRLLLHQAEEHRSKLASLERQRAQKSAELETVRATVDKLAAVIPILRERVQIRETLFSHETGSKANYLELLQALVETQKDVDVQRSRAVEAQASLAAITEAHAQADAEYRRVLSTELVEASRKVAGLKEELVKSEQRTKYQALTAPVDGTVQQLSVHTVGGVVTPAQPLMVLVPADSHLEIEAMLSNRDIGFVSVGNEAEIKVDTFNFTRYGLVRGRVVTLSHDAITRERPVASGDTAADAAGSSSEPKGQELVYAARISLDTTQMQVEDKLVDLSPGMAVTVEIKTGSQRIIQYLLSPISRRLHDSLRER